MNPEIEARIARFVRERDEMLRSLDPQRIMAFHAKHNPASPPMRPEVALPAAHKARAQAASLTEDEREVSRAWLKEHGYSVPP